MLSLRRPPSRLGYHGSRRLYATELSNRRRQKVIQPPATNKNEQNCIFVRLPLALKSMPEILAVVRSIEGQFGRVKDYHFPRDPYDRQSYLRPYLNLRLEHKEDWERIPTTASKLEVEVPVHKQIQGGPGLEDIDHLLHAGDRIREGQFQALIEESRNSDASTKPDTRTVEIEVERTDFSPNFDHKLRRYLTDAGKTAEFGRSFVRWGGFHQPTHSTSADTMGPPLSHMAALKERYVIQEHALPDEPVSVDQDAIAEEFLTSQVDGEIATGTSDVLANQPEQDVAEANADPSQAQSPSLQTSTPMPTLTGTSGLDQPIRSRRRERLLELARMNAQQPLSPSVYPSQASSLAERDQKKKDTDEEKARVQAVRDSIRERLWRLMGGRS